MRRWTRWGPAAALVPLGVMQPACSAERAAPATSAIADPSPSAALGPMPSAEARPALTVAPLPRGWWVVTDDGANPPEAAGMAFRFEDMSYVVVRLDGKVDRRRCRRWESHADSWLCDGSIPLTITPKGGTTRMRLAGGELRLVPAAAERVATLDAAAAGAPDVIALCNRAERCCLDAMPLLNAACNVELELADKSSSLACERFLAGMRAILMERRVDAPPACSAEGGAPP